MALTLQIVPQDLTPAYNQQKFVAISDQIGVSDFKYIVTIEVNASGTIFTETIYAAPDGTMTFDAKEYVMNYIEHYFNPNISLLSPCELATNKTVSVEVKIKEYYTAAIQSTTTTNYEAFDACLSNEDFDNYDVADYIATGTLNYSGLTDTTVTPDNRIDLTSDLWLHFINDVANPITNIVLQNRSSIGTVIQTITIAAIPSSTLNYPTYVVNVTPRMFTAPVVGGSVRIQCKNAATTNIIDTSFTLTDICTNYTDYKLYYLDRTGNVLFFNFELVSQENVNKSTNTVRLATSSVNSWEREKHVVSTQLTKQITLTSNWITETQSTQLNNLFDSPIVWLYLNEVYTPITITDTNYKLNKHANEPLFNYVVNCEYGLTNSRQRGI